MQLRVTVEILKGNDNLCLGEHVVVTDTDSIIAQGQIVGDLDLKRGRDVQPVLSIQMRNILAKVQETIYTDSNI
jgi:hypothetical protein